MPIALPRLIAGLCLAAVAVPSHAQQIVVNKDNRTIAVTTSAEASADADTVTVEIGFLEYGADQDSAYALGSKTSNAIAAALKAAGVPQDAMQSESQSIGPVQNYGNGDQNWTAAEKTGRKFQVQQAWSVKTAAANGARVLDIAVKAGANLSGQMSWSVEDQDALQAKAAKLALDRARGIAQQMAAGLNAALGPLVYASNEAPSREPQPMMRMGGGRVLAPATQSVMIAPLAVNARKVTASATVYAVFSIQ